MHQFFKCEKDELCELVRVALKKHETPTTKIVAIALKLLKKSNTGLKLVFSYADQTRQNHKGIIYRAGNWQYLCERRCKNGYIELRGKIYHARSMNSKYGSVSNFPDGWKRTGDFVKHLFVYYLR